LGHYIYYQDNSCNFNYPLISSGGFSRSGIKPSKSEKYTCTRPAQSTTPANDFTNSKIFPNEILLKDFYAFTFLFVPVTDANRQLLIIAGIG
jgi:hypothetical protein